MDSKLPGSNTPSYVVPLFVGCLLHYGLFGALVVQFFHYLIAYHSADRLIIKTMAYTVLVVVTFQTIVMTMFVWLVFVSRSGDLGVYLQTPWLAMAPPPLNATVAAMVEVFFAWRIWSFKRTKSGLLIAASIMVLALLQWMCGIANIALYAIQRPSAFDMDRLGAITLGLTLVPTCVCDMTIALTMFVLLRRARQNAVFRRTDLLLSRLIANSLESGAVTAIMAILELLIYVAIPRTMMYVAILAIRGNLYANVLFASLNGRKAAYQTRLPHSAADPLSTLRFAGDAEWDISQVEDSWTSTQTYRGLATKPELLSGTRLD